MLSLRSLDRSSRAPTIGHDGLFEAKIRRVTRISTERDRFSLVRGLLEQLRCARSTNFCSSGSVTASCMFSDSDCVTDGSENVFQEYTVDSAVHASKRPEQTEGTPIFNGGRHTLGASHISSPSVSKTELEHPSKIQQRFPLIQVSAILERIREKRKSILAVSAVDLFSEKSGEHGYPRR